MLDCSTNGGRFKSSVVGAARNMTNDGDEFCRTSDMVGIDRGLDE